MNLVSRPSRIRRRLDLRGRGGDLRRPQRLGFFLRGGPGPLDRRVLRVVRLLQFLPRLRELLLQFL